ncbi:signal peptidase I [Papillibacter cinnamivorans]|uniref:Signal peptidase I n=1 Tax=Papillibacter cinnamivorans DSM 12816 TaxID=1122930 RepID=A0A1W1YUX2_9FIRM|nr:signal peptidase I [Papillibacter cinnamivorans]SMC39641.1 signal peptidase I [Papillibacter cinnamivorans DSM 12816]
MDNDDMHGIDPAEDGVKPSELECELYEWLQALVTAIVCIVLIFTFLFRIISVDGFSMLPTLHDKDKILVLSSLIYTPRDGDIIVLRKESFIEQPIVKRVIATENQTVDINFITGEVSVDGVVLDEPYIAERTYTMYDVSFPVTVPKGCVFVMGDNRNESSDSRVAAVGMVDTRYILGHVVFTLFPLNRIGVEK